MLELKGKRWRLTIESEDATLLAELEAIGKRMMKENRSKKASEGMKQWHKAHPVVKTKADKKAERKAAIDAQKAAAYDALVAEQDKMEEEIRAQFDKRVIQ